MSIDRRFLDVRLCVRSKVNEPAETKPGIQYIVGSAPTGAFAGAHENDIAVYDGYASKWKFFTPQQDQIEVMNLESGKWERWSGTTWEAFADIGGGGGTSASEVFLDPVLDVVATGTVLPGTATAGDKFLDTATGKLHTATGTDTWDAGTDTNDGDRYASSTDAKIYERTAGTFAGTTPNDGALFISKATDRLYCYDGGTASIRQIGSDATIPDATYTEKGKVVIDQAGGLKVEGGKVSMTRRTVTFKHALTSEEVTNKAFDLPKKVCAGMEGQVAVAVGGVVQTPGDDYEVVDGGTKSTIQWTGKGLADIALVEGDVFVLTYPTDEA